MENAASRGKAGCAALGDESFSIGESNGLMHCITGGIKELTPPSNRLSLRNEQDESGVTPETTFGFRRILNLPLELTF
jgi:hypothetical protein